jgi:hypothetical protein
MEKSFKEWFKELDELVTRVSGLSALDLPDFCYKDAFNSGCTPTEIAFDCLFECGYPVQHLEQALQ